MRGFRGGWPAAGLALLVVLGACSSSGLTSASGGRSPTASAIAAPIAGTTFDKAPGAAVSALPFVNQDGRSVRLDSLRGQTVVLTDFLTLCQEVCPLTAGTFEQIARKVQLAGASGTITLLEITIDPARDTPARLKAYSKNLGAGLNWQFWTGSPTNIAALWKQLGVFYEKVPDAPGTHPVDWWTGKTLSYDVDHQDVVFVLGADGHEKWLTQGTPNLQAGPLPSFLAHLLNDQGRANVASPGVESWTAGDVTAALSYVTGRRIG